MTPQGNRIRSNLAIFISIGESREGPEHSHYFVEITMKTINVQIVLHLGLTSPALQGLNGLVGKRTEI